MWPLAVLKECSSNKRYMCGRFVRTKKSDRNSKLSVRRGSTVIPTISTDLRFDFQEVNDVLQRVSGESQPVPLWRTASTEDLDSMKEKEFPLFYSFRLNLKVTGSQGGVLNF